MTMTMPMNDMPAGGDRTVLYVFSLALRPLSLFEGADPLEMAEIHPDEESLADDVRSGTKPQ